MPTVGRIISVAHRAINCVGTCSEGHSADRFSRISSFSSLTIRDSVFDIPSSSGTKNVFTTAERTGDFRALCPAGFDSTGKCTSNSGANVQLYNPCVSFTAPCTPSSPAATTRQIFPFNQIPGAMISPVAQALFASPLYPTAIGTGLQQNAINTTARPLTWTRATSK